MPKEFSRRSTKKADPKQLQQGNTTNTTVMEEKNDNIDNSSGTKDSQQKDPNEKSTYEKHKEFIKDGIKTDGPSQNGPPVDMTPSLEKPALEQSVFNTPTVENEYISKNRGLNTNTTPPPNGNANNQSFNPTEPPPPGGNTNQSSTASTGQWEPSEPPPVSAPDSAPEADQGPPPPGADGQPFTIPAGTAEETIQWGFDMFNYGIVNIFGGFVVDVKVGKQHLVKLPASAIDPMTNLINEKNQKNRERLKFSQEEINMIKRPLAKIMAEKGVRGLTPTEELAMAAIIVIGKKGKEIAEIRSENKVLVSKIAQLIAEETAKQNKGKKNQNDAEEAEVIEEDGN